MEALEDLRHAPWHNVCNTFPEFPGLLQARCKPCYRADVDWAGYSVTNVPDLVSQREGTWRDKQLYLRFLVTPMASRLDLLRFCLSASLSNGSTYFDLLCHVWHIIEESTVIAYTESLVATVF